MSKRQAVEMMGVALETAICRMSVEELAAHNSGLKRILDHFEIDAERLLSKREIRKYLELSRLETHC